MSGDWIKMRVNLWDDPRVGRVCDLTGAKEAAVIGSLYWLWTTADQHSADGILPGLSMQQIDRKTGLRGFAAALVAIGWLADHPEGVRVVHFDEHNGASAKKRAETARRVANHRYGNAQETQKYANGNADSVTTALARDREEKKEKPPKPPATPSASLHRFPPGFETLWAEYPRKVGKDAAAKAFAKRRPDDALLSAMVSAVRTQRQSEQWQRDGGQFIPHLSTWLNGGRWADEEQPCAPQRDDVFAGAR